uniref:Period circadian protein homolog 2 n=1 Tax=Sphaeramia orbicularis TaxID=375764 RepID=A0A673CEY8_9TELE
MSGYSQGGPDLGLPSEGSDSSGQEPSASPHNHRKNTRSRSLPEEDVEMKSSGSSGSGTESHGNESHGNESHGNESHGHESTGSSNGNSKDSALLESSESNKSSNSHSPSPPSSSNAFSLLSSEQDNPSTSGCSSEESAKAKTQKEVIKTLKELKLHLPAEKRHNNKSTTLNTLKYALRCVKQVEANEEYYQLLMINDSQPSGLDVSSYTIEEIDSITSEYTLKNNDIFAVAVSLITGRIVYISDQAASILNCKRDVFKNSKFVEFLTPQDVSVFYSFTTPYRLPSWSMCTGAESSPPDCMQEKSFFCRIRWVDAGRYYPFRMTPYLMKVQDTVHAEDQFCCLLLAERVHSGYDAPRIPTDKRIFTTTHTPSCVFQDVDERAVPLLGYLPQDLIGTPVLLHLHPNDRPIMLAIHRKILQYAGQPFDHSSIRFCARNGEYIILDTSWSSFVNPWSRKVSFVIGRHKVRMGPVNEDVFVAPSSAVGEVKGMDSDIQEITEQIHRLLLQVRMDEVSPVLCSLAEPALMKDQSGLSTLGDQDKKSSDAATAVVGTSLPLPVPNKPESVVSITSQCSYSSTIVHVGDKKPQPESEIIEDVPGTGETAESSPNPVPPPCAVSPPSQERESYKKLGLTKQVLAAHTQKEEQAFLFRFKELRTHAALKGNCSEYLERRREQIANDVMIAIPSMAELWFVIQQNVVKFLFLSMLQVSSHGDGNNSDANSSSSDMLDIILHEDSCSGTGSATSGSMASNGCGTSASGTSNSGTSKSRTSGSGTSASHLSGIEGRPMETEQSEHFIKYVLQDPVWLLTANTDDKTMMTYQLPSRDIQRVLREDREKLRQLHKSQPRFTEEQKKELMEVHPWMKKGGLPKAIDIKVHGFSGEKAYVKICFYVKYEYSFNLLQF